MNYTSAFRLFVTLIIVDYQTLGAQRHFSARRQKRSFPRNGSLHEILVAVEVAQQV